MPILIGTPHTKNCGHYYNDDTPSGGKKSEADIQTCSHCQAIVNLQGSNFGWCQREMKPLCNTCGIRAHTHGCEPFLKKIEAALDDNYHKAQFRKIAGLEGEYKSVIFTGQT